MSKDNKYISNLFFKRLEASKLKFVFSILEAIDVIHV